MVIRVAREITTFGNLHEEEITTARTVCRLHSFVIQEPVHCPGAGPGQGWLIFAGPGPDPPGPGLTLADPDPGPSYI